MMNKKGATLWDIFATILLVMIAFFGLFGYMAYNYAESGVVDEIGYTAMNETISFWQNNLSDNVEDVELAASEISEADGGALSIAWNGLKGIAATLRLFFNLIAVAVGLSQELLPALSFLPFWIIPMIRMAITILIVLVIIGAYKGEAKT